MDNLEKKLEKKEDAMMEGVNEIPRDFEAYIMTTRKELTMWKRFYNQLVGMAQVFQDCPNGIVDVDAKDMFRFFLNKAERLQADTQILREYTLQLRDMYQSRIDVRQNKVVYFKKKKWL